MQFFKPPGRFYLLAMLAGSAAAETSSLPPIFVTASRVAEAPQDTLYSVSVVTREDIEEAQARDVSDLLQRLPGVQTGRNGGPGQVTSAFIRGAASDHTLLLIDGVPVNSGTVGSPALQHLMTDQIERIEVVRGPASTLHGSSAIGGVVQIFTRRAASGGDMQITAGAGSQSTDHYSGSASYGGENLSAVVSASRRTSSGYPTRPSLSREDRGYRNESFNAALGTRLGEADMEFSYFEAEGFVEYLDFFGTPVDQDTKNSVMRFVIDYAPNTQWDSRLLLGRARDETDENQSDDFADTVRDYIDWQNTVQLDSRQTLVAGVTASWTDTKLLSFGSGYDESTRSVEVYVQDTIRFGDSRVQIGARGIDDEEYGTHLTWNAAIGHALTTSTRLHANAGTAFRAPSANDRYGFGGDPDFDPEESISGEIGVEHRLTGADSIRLVGFVTEIDDLIETNPATFTVEQTEQARIRGVELAYAHESNDWQWSLDYTYQDPKNNDVDQLLPRRARNTVNAEVRYGLAGWWAGARLRYQSERRDSRFSDITMDAYTTVGINAGYRFGRSLTIAGRVENLFDESYELAATYPGQDRFVGVELRYDYDAR